MPELVEEDPVHESVDYASKSTSTDPAKTPATHPDESSKPSRRPDLDSKENEAYEKLLAIVQAWADSASANDSGTTQHEAIRLTESEKFWLTRECLLRYLRACKWSVTNAATRLQATLAWRREWGVESHTAEMIAPENETGKIVLYGYDIECRPALYLFPHRQNTKVLERQMQHLVFMLERCIDLMPAGQETMALLVNYGDTKRGDSGGLSKGRQTLHILQNHYPERLGRALVQQVPWFIWGFFKAIGPFMDPVTKEKLKFDQDLKQLIPSTQLLKSFGGNVEFEYQHELYWPALIQLAEKRRQEMRRRWEQAGSKLGESEFYLKGGQE